MIEFQRRLYGLALLERVFQRKKHHVVTAGLKRDGLARLDFHAAFNGPHLHDAAFHCNAVNLTLRAGIR